MKLVIVESPTKARKLSGYLSGDYAIEASVGHVRDLPKSGLGIDIDNNFEPTYEVSDDKKKVVNKLKKLAKTADQIFLATDPDREGEAIAWHIHSLLESKDNQDKFARSTFNEITKPAVLSAIENPSKLNLHLVDAQQARRIVDRLVGYKLSPVLWKKIRRGLSAGRVQSVALRLIAEREREIEAFVPDEYWELDVALNQENKQVSIFNEEGKFDELPDPIFIARVVEVEGAKYEPTTEADVTDVVAALKQASYQVAEIEKKQRKRSSLPPFTTSTMQQTAATRLGMTSKQSMRLAQQLYEEGLITYHRTDSVNLSQQAITMARDFIAGKYGQEYLPAKPRVFSKKSKNAQEAHEAVRVTDAQLDPQQVISKGSRMTERHVKLYDLIRRRYLASQMKPAVYDQTALFVAYTSPHSQASSGVLKTNGSIMVFDGWMKLFPGGGDQILPDVSKGQDLFYSDLFAAQKFTQPPARYNDASLVKELEKRGIGRPSTYASIISVIEDRGYVERDARRFKATAIGLTVSDFLLEHFPKIMDYDFTATMEDKLDDVALGKQDWHDLVAEYYQPLESKIDTVIEKADRKKIPVEKTGEKCPDCGDTDQGEIVIRTGKFGKFKSCSRYPECKFTENIVEKLEGQHCPLCQKGDVITRKSRWGKPFFGCGRYPDCDWASWKKPEPGLIVTPEEWAEQQAARKARAEARKKKAGASKSKSTAKKKSTKKKTTKKTTKKSTKKNSKE